MHSLSLLLVSFTDGIWSGFGISAINHYALSLLTKEDILAVKSTDK